ncbi:MAG: polyphosphate kinase 2 family protein [Candidatus Binatia bacterium]
MARKAAMAKKPSELAVRYRVTSGKRFRLEDFDPGDTGGLPQGFKREAKALLQLGTAELTELQDKLYAQDRWALLLIFQALDAAGKDSTIEHVFSGVNPQGCQVHSFKAPSAEELDHDFLWRTTVRLPERGRFGIFNRSYYEEVLVVRVHRELLAKQKLPPELLTKKIWQERYEDINAFERYLSRNGTVILKFFLHVSREEQRKRFLKRLNEPEKNWKFSLVDVAEHRHWDDYQEAYAEAIRATATEHAPWYVVPADNKWFTRLIVAAAIIARLKGLDLVYPEIDSEKRKELRQAREVLLAEQRTRSRKRA